MVEERLERLQKRTRWKGSVEDGQYKSRFVGKASAHLEDTPWNAAEGFSNSKNGERRGEERNEDGAN